MDIEPHNIEWAWKRAATGGYNYGCVIFFLADGVVIRSQKQHVVIPAGATAFDGEDQYCSCPETTQIVAMAFEEDAVIHALGKERDALGYSLAYHKALIEASIWTRPE